MDFSKIRGPIYLPLLPSLWAQVIPTIWPGESFQKLHSLYKTHPDLPNIEKKQIRLLVGGFFLVKKRSNEILHTNKRKKTRHESWKNPHQLWLFTPNKIPFATDQPSWSLLHSPWTFTPVATVDQNHGAERLISVTPRQTGQSYP